jgi:glycosyltransferase involved in cell wall biosynthesis
LLSISKARQLGTVHPFKFWICGPDYNEGYSKIRLTIEQLNLQNYVEILSPDKYTPGTIGYLKNADFVVAFSRWDGYARVMRECMALGIPIITNEETHFDRLISKFGIGVIANSTDQLAKVMINLKDQKIQAIKKTIQLNTTVHSEYISWSSCAARFLNTFKNIEL